ncbi:MAG: glycosyltransferase family 2 protein [Verrucomicrobia bacterium]|jgi:glycosyltransferase involved in cell wall biosynthesis|nr:glycosyltransferase family 2 protein [Verrucomicrobiota bacterium]MBT7065176.1 glycosyltransferase family 2 protein [Verrucomicrobiota bacterium]MBT7699385.1 glycosyltransferase family 2 protein [Verrucomicrobiota bacterium]
MPDRISVCITAGNEEHNIRRCLESVTWASEIIVVDSFSTDRTVEICKEYTDLVYQHRWLGYIGQKNLIKDLASGSWILFIDADEEISPGLRDEILEEFRSGRNERYDGYEFPRMVRYLHRWIRHGDWYPDTKLRLFNKSEGRCGGREPHDRIEVDGSVRRLKNPMYHYTYSCIDDQIASMNKFSSITAGGQFEDGRPLRMMDFLLRPFLRFLRGYFIKLGFMDGIPGLIVAMSSAYGVFAKYAKLWEQHLNARLGPDAALGGSEPTAESSAPPPSSPPAATPATLV